MTKPKTEQINLFNIFLFILEFTAGFYLMIATAEHLKTLDINILGVWEFIFQIGLVMVVFFAVIDLIGKSFKYLDKRKVKG